MPKHAVSYAAESGRSYSRLVLLLAAIALCGNASGVTYTSDFGGLPPSYGRHWDEFIFRYTPGVGWFRDFTMGRGNADARSGYLNIISDNGSEGETIDVDLRFAIKVNSSYTSVGYGFDITSEVEALSNFGGMDDGELSGTFSVSSEGLIKEWVPQPVERSLLDNGEAEFGIVVPFSTGLLPLSYSDRAFNISTSHLDFEPFGLKVVDSSLPAVFALRAEVIVSVREAKIVPDSGSIILMLTSACGIIFLFRRFRVKHH